MTTQESSVTEVEFCPNTPRANAPGQPKQMSSRLLTMKFMQRASSTNARSSTSRPTSTSQPATPASEPSSKRQKIDHTPDSSVPTTPATEPNLYASRSDIKAALQAESAFEALARAKRAELGFGHNEYESEWVLNVPVSAAQTVQDDATHDSEDESEHSDGDLQGRQTYGGYKRRKKNISLNMTASTPGSKSSTPAQKYKFDDFDSDDEEDEEGEDSEDESEDGELDSDAQETPRKTPTSGSGKKRKAYKIDEDDEAAMSALDKADLSMTGYAKSKGAGSGTGHSRSDFHKERSKKIGKGPNRSDKKKKMRKKGKGK